MRDRQTTLLWMKDLIDHMARCHEQLEWAGDDAEGFLTRSIVDDLDECRRLVERLKPRARRHAMAGAA